MKFSVESGQLKVKDIKIASISAGSIALIGDCRTVQLGSWFETPPETAIVGVTPSLRTIREA